MFEDVSKKWGLGISSFSNGAVFSDLDLDGDIDYVVNNINDKAFIFLLSITGTVFSLKWLYCQSKLLWNVGI